MEEIKDKHVRYWKMMRDEGRKNAGKISLDQIFAFEQCWLTIKHITPELEQLRKEYKLWAREYKQAEEERDKLAATAVMQAITKLADNIKDPKNFAMIKHKQSELFA